jgi:hypothetical protein
VGQNLSGDQRQAISFLPVPSKAPLVMMDEPTSALDPSRSDVISCWRRFQGAHAHHSDARPRRAEDVSTWSRWSMATLRYSMP